MDAVSYISRIYKPSPTYRLPIEIPSLSRNELARIFAKLGFTKGALVGVWNGAYAKVLCKSNPRLTLFGIDINNRTDSTALPSNCRLVRSASQAAVRKVVDNSLDFVYLDTDADFSSATNDLKQWSKKIRRGGIIAGHDYKRYRSSCSVRTYEAVHAYTQSQGISPWFVIGRQTDQIRSWFWTKA